ncbi:MAG: hypothetical protein JWL61_5447 [Gemmatimonadetes bacterium]|nr:hypothetical protein [Gemmatimonadota bacterium]
MSAEKPDYELNALEAHLIADDEVRYFAQDAAILAVTEAINDAMEALGVTRAELARRLKRTPGFISQVLSGSRNMTIKTFADIALALGLQLRNVELSPVGEMRVPYDSMDQWLEQWKEQNVATASVYAVAGSSVPASGWTKLATFHMHVA